MILAGLGILAILLATPYLLGIRTYAVLSGSMEPNIKTGGLVYVQKIDPERIAAGDVITFSLESGDSMLATHRVVSVDATQRVFVTKGDANNVEDAPVSFDRLVGRVVLDLPYLGFLTQGIKTKQGILFASGVLLVLVLTIFLPELLPQKNNPSIQKET